MINDRRTKAKLIELHLDEEIGRGRKETEQKKRNNNKYQKEQW